MPNIQVLPASTYKRPTPSKFLRFLLGGKQAVGSGNVLDLSGLGNNAVIGSGTDSATVDATFWGTPGFMNPNGAGPGAGQGATVPGSGVNAPGAFNLFAGDGAVLCLTVQMAYPGFGMAIVGNATNSPGVNIGESSTNTGGLGVSVTDNSINTYAAAVQSQFKVADGGLHKIIVAINGNSAALPGVDTGPKTLRIIADLTELAPANGGVFNAAAPGNTIPSYGFGIGHSGNPSASGTVSTKVRDVHMYVIPAGSGVFPKSVMAIARYYALKPELPIPASIMGG